MPTPREHIRTLWTLALWTLDLALADLIVCLLLF